MNTLHIGESSFHHKKILVHLLTENKRQPFNDCKLGVCNSIESFLVCSRYLPIALFRVAALDPGDLLVVVGCKLVGHQVVEYPSRLVRFHHNPTVAQLSVVVHDATFEVFEKRLQRSSITNSLQEITEFWIVSLSHVVQELDNETIF